MAEERDFENGWKWKEFKLSRARDHDLRSGHTAYRRASLNDLYLYTKFHSNVFEIYAVVRFTPLRGRRNPGGADRGVPSTEMD